MNDPLLMGCLQRLGDLFSNRERLIDRDRSLGPGPILAAVSLFEQDLSRRR